MKDVTIPDHARSWDRFNAFHCACQKADGSFSGTNSYGGGSPIILFDTGELICTLAQFGPDFRGRYDSVGIELTTTKDLDLYLPDGTRCAKAWLDDSGMQYLLHDFETCVAVRTDGSSRNAPHQNSKGSPITPGIPKRFQYNARAYFPGPGLPPQSHDKIAVRRPLRSAKFTPDELEHIHMIVATGQAAMKLTSHDAAVGKRVGEKATADPNVLLNCKTWMEVPNKMLPALAQKGCTHLVEEYDYLLTTVG